MEEPHLRAGKEPVDEASAGAVRDANQSVAAPADALDPESLARPDAVHPP